MSDDTLSEDIAILRAEAGKVGSMSSLWDLVMTGEAIQSGSGSSRFAPHWPYNNEEEARAEIHRRASSFR